MDDPPEADGPWTMDDGRSSTVHRPTAAEGLIRQRIARDGPLTFAAFLDLALYHPRVGYYSRREPVFGREGDYFTSPELHPAFAACLGRQVRQVWEALGHPPDFVLHEAGPGSGVFCRDLLRWAAAEAPDLLAALLYRLDERSAALRERQREMVAEAPPGARVEWIEGFSAGPLRGCVLANELLDALPFHLVTVERGELRELYVGLEADRLAFVAREPSTPHLRAYFDRVGLLPPEGVRAEVGLAALDWMAAAAGALEQGLLVALDYGLPAERLYGPGRPTGTVLTYYRHTLGSDPLRRVGEQDVTAHVDFTSLRLAGETAGLQTLGLVSQATLLERLGLAEYAAAIRAAPLPGGVVTRNLRNLAALSDPDGLGRVGALFQARGLPGFVPLGLIGPDLTPNPLSGAERGLDLTPNPLSGAERGPFAPPSRAGKGAGGLGPPYVPLMDARHLALPDPAGLDLGDDFEAMWREAWEGEDTPSAY